MEDKDFLSNAIDKIFSIKKSTLSLILIFILGFVLRLIAAINLSVTADDMHHVTDAINFFSADKLVHWGQSSGLWHSFTSIIYDVFIINQLTSRFAALIFGSLTILLIYLLTKEFFNKKVALLSAFLLAIAPFHIKNTIAEMDAMAMFFVLVSMLFFVKAIKIDKNLPYVISGVFMGLAVYTKVYPLLFIPSLILFFIYYNKKNKTNPFSDKNVKKIFIFLIFVFLFTIPALTHNYLLYKDKGFLDLQFTRTLGLGKDISAQYYSWDAQFEAKNSWKGLFVGDTKHSLSGKPLLWVAINYIQRGDPVVFYLGIIGILFFFIFKKENKEYLLFFLFNILLILPFLASVILLSKHFLFLELFLIPLAAFSLSSIYLKLKLKKNAIKLSLIIIFGISLIVLGIYNTPTVNHFYGKSDIAQAIDFKNKEIPKGALAVADSRIYRGRVNWMLNNRPYFEGSEFINMLNNQENLGGEIVPTQIFFFECISDDCGWGNVKDQPEFNNSMEALTNLFKDQGQLVKIIEEPDKERNYYPIISGERENTINIYSATFPLKQETLTIACQPKEWFLYTIGYEEPKDQFDYYQTSGFLDYTLNLLAHWIVILAVILAFLSPFYVIYLTKKSIS